MITRIEGMADNHALVFARSEDGYWTAQVPPDLRMARTTSPLQPGIWRATAHITPRY